MASRTAPELSSAHLPSVESPRTIQSIGETMGTASFEVMKYGETKGRGAASLPGALVTSGIHTTSTTASNLTDGAAGAGSAISVARGQILWIFADTAMRFKLGGETASAHDGYYIPANQSRGVEVVNGGAVSIVDVA